MDAQEEAEHGGRRQLTKGLWVVFLAMVVAQFLATAFNISYNLVHISPLLTEAQGEAFRLSIQLYNGIAFPILVILWWRIVFFLAKPWETKEELAAIQRRAVSLPWWAAVLATIGWLLAIPALCLGILYGGGTLNSHVWFHLPMALLTSMVIGVALGYLSIDWLRIRKVFPHFFRDYSPARLRAGKSSVTSRGILWIVSASVGPIVALLMLLISPSPAAKNIWFAVAVAAVGIGCAVCGAILLFRLVAEPVRELREAAQRVGMGDKNVLVGNLHVDEFGILADEFNDMVAGLREKERVEETFGRHVGREVAAELLKSESDLEGVEREISVLFSDIRGFTTRCESLTPKDAVRLLNEFHATMTALIEENGGLVNTIMGDGFMALFGATGSDSHYADSAVNAGRAMLCALPELNARLQAIGFEPITIGVGINTGPAVVGTVGSPRRLDYTAIGDTVNTAARIESMTKELKEPLLVSESTWEHLTGKLPGKKLDPQPIRGRKESIVLYSISGSE